MPPLINPRLVNPPFGDPGLFAPFFHKKRALLFDLGDISSLSPKDILKITHCFVSHAHMEHFIGFDHLLRIMLGREKVLRLYGPERFTMFHFSPRYEGKAEALNTDAMEGLRSGGLHFLE